MEVKIVRRIGIVDTHPDFLKEVPINSIPEFDANDYLQRVNLFIERLKENSITHAVIYGDREHFSNIEYLSGYDPRFEEALLIIDAEGNKTIIIGNEGWSYSYKIPYEINRVLYQNFSLQGQPRESLRPLSEIFANARITSHSRVGVVGYKYFEAGHASNPDYTFDIPAYILDSIYALVKKENVINITRELTGSPNGIRMVLRTAKEIAWAENAANKCANIILRLMKNLKPNIAEIELSATCQLDFCPTNVHPMLNFGPEHVFLGIRSPGYRRLNLGEVCGMCYSIRGALTSRVGVAAYDYSSYNDELKGSLENFYMPYWEAVATWYESVGVGVVAGEVYNKVMDIIGGPEFGVKLNPGHNIGTDEWTNSPFYKGSEIRIPDGSHFQCDMIASSSNPVKSAICEDSVVIAGKELRGKVKSEYPDVWARIEKRQKLMREELGISISDDVLPLSNINAVYWPFMLDTGKILAFR